MPSVTSLNLTPQIITVIVLCSLIHNVVHNWMFMCLYPCCRFSGLMQLVFCFIYHLLNVSWKFGRLVLWAPSEQAEHDPHKFRGLTLWKTLAVYSGHIPCISITVPQYKTIYGIKANTTAVQTLEFRQIFFRISIKGQCWTTEIEKERK